MTISESDAQAVARSDSDVVLSVENLSVTYDMDRGIARVLNQVDMDIRRNEIHGIVGESGSGKSMFAASLLDAVPPPGETTGRVTFHSERGSQTDVLELSDQERKAYRWEDVSMVFQGAMSSFNPTMSIRQHFEETIHAHNHDLEERMPHAEELLYDLQLDPDRVLDSYPHELSGGMRQRALIALSLVLDPEVLVMDEPTAALDLLMQRSIISLLHTLKDRYGLTIIFITHDLPLVAGLCDRLSVLYAFEFIETGPTNEVLREATHPYTRWLLRSVPSIDTDIEEMESIEGTSPDPVNVPQGCSFHPRCPLADEQCFTSHPPLADVGEDHETACYYPDESVDLFPYELGAEAIDDRQAGTDAEGQAGRMVDDPVLSLQDVRVHFEDDVNLKFIRNADGTTTRAVDGVSLAIGDEDVVALVGESGCGKTTLGKTGIGLQRPTEGSVEFHGQDLWDAREGLGYVDIPYDEIRRALQIVHQDPGSSLNPNQTVMKSMTVPIQRTRPDMDVETRERTILGMLERMGLTPADDYAYRFPHQLSGGEQQRVALGRALLMQPEVILADEAVSALDVSLRVEMMELMLEMQDLFDTSYLFISHDFSNARYLAEKANGRIGVMYLGKLVEIGDVEEVLYDPKHPYTKVLTWATPVLDPDRAREAAQSEPPVRDIDVPSPDDPPSGCNFHPRCSSIIPPEDLDISQDEFNDITDVRFAIRDRDLDLGVLLVESDDVPDDPRQVAIGDAVDVVLDEFVDGDLGEPHASRVHEAVAAVVEAELNDGGDADQVYGSVTDELARHYESVCERVEPTISDEGHPAACHLYDAEPAETPAIHADDGDTAVND